MSTTESTTENTTLYQKIQRGKAVRYIPYTPAPSPVPHADVFTDEEIITLGVSMGTLLLIQLEQNIPPQKRNCRKVKAVTDAILDLAHGLGKPIDPELVSYWADIWNETIRRYQAGLLSGLPKLN